MQKPTFNEALKFWTKLGFISFGGSAGQIAIMHEFLVDKNKWISESKFLHALNYCMLLPGPEAQQLATYAGWMLHGTLGGIAAGVLFVLPSMFILLALSVVYVLYGNVPWILAIFSVLKPAVVAIIILALVKIAKKSLRSIFHYIVCIVTFISIYFYNISFPVIIIVTITIALLFSKFLGGFEEKKTNLLEDETEYYINKHTIINNKAFDIFSILRKISFGVFLWLIPMAIFYFFTSDFGFWSKLSLFFTKTAFVTFGGAYAVLPYVAEASVEDFNWLTKLQMIDGLALGETTPGPLVMVLAFVGFMAGFNSFDGSISMGVLGLLITTFYTFLPSFFFIFIGAPIIEQTQENNKVRQTLSLLTVTVVGVILNLTIYLTKEIVFINSISFSGINYPSLFWIIISFIAMYRFKINIIKWIFISSVVGLVCQLLN